MLKMLSYATTITLFAAATGCGGSNPEPETPSEAVGEAVEEAGDDIEEAGDDLAEDDDE